ncbi:hypothetical protein IWQ60_005236 [Tieghemiomyces parasiticus]|uniref:Uncharacterized protein n=1 Tax=Tieghemiomyces parasiticus TaxID=78921 RepID=A0A9W8ACS1_9FUNG|nr:hypothetical protein IWQ60_005236 [Tieghemiomyces parasiticus]
MDHTWGVRFTRSTWFQCMFIHLCDGPVQNEEVQNEFIRTYLTAPYLNYRGRAERNESGKKDDHASTHSLVKRLSLLIHQDLKVMMFRDHKHVSYDYSQLPYLTLSGRYPLLYAIRKHRYALVNAVWSAWNQLASYTGMHLSKYPTIHFPSFGPPTGVVTSTILRDVSERMLFDMGLSDMRETRGLSPSTLFHAVAIAKLNTLKAAIIADNVAAVLSMLQIEKTFRNEQPMDYIQITIAWSAMYGADQVKAYMSAFLVSLDYGMNDFLTVWHCAQAYKLTQIDQFFLKHWPASHWENYHIPFPIPSPEICRNTLSARIRPDLSLDTAFVLSVPILDKPNGRQPM